MALQQGLCWRQMGLASGFKEYGAGSSIALGLARAYLRSLRGESFPDTAPEQASQFDPSIHITVASMASRHVCSLFHILTTKSSAPEIKDHPLQALPCRCDDEDDFRPVEGHDVIVRCEGEQMGSYQLGLRFIDLGMAWAGEKLEVRRFHILAGAILERPASITCPVRVLEASELRPFGSPNQYLKLEFRRPAVLHAALIPSFNLDILAAMMDAKSKAFREIDRHVQREFVNACWLMSQMVRIFEKVTSCDPADVHGDKVPGVGEDLLLEVKQKLRWTKGMRINKRSHDFLSNTTRCRSDDHHTAWCSVGGKCWWIETPLNREEIWEIENVVRMEYKPPTDCRDGRLIVIARTANVEIRHPCSTTIRGRETADLPAGFGVWLRVPNVIQINFRSYTMGSQPVLVGMGMLPSDTSGLSTCS